MVRASMRARAALLLAFVVPIAGCIAQSAPARAGGFDDARLARVVDSIARRIAPGRLGVAAKLLDSGESWSSQGTRSFPMQSVFKAPLGAAVLAAVDRGELSLSRQIVLGPADLSPPYSRVSAAFPERTTYTVDELLVAAAGGSDNTAADVLMALVGGPGVVTQWLESREVRGLRIDRFEREFQVQMAGMPPFRREWATEAGFLAAFEAVAPERRRAAAAAYLADPRDTSTPLAAVAFLERLQAGSLLSPASTSRLLRIMTETTTGASRIKAALPAGATLAHKTGSARPDQGMNAAVNDIGIVTLADGRRIAIAVFLSGTRMPYESAEAVHAAVARAVIGALH